MDIDDPSRLIRITHGVHRPADVAADDVGRLAALLSAAPDGTVLCGLTAARLHGLWLPEVADRRVEVIVHPGITELTRRPHSRRSELRSRRQKLGPDQVVRVAGLPVTDPATTWLHLAARLRPCDLVAAGDSVLRLGTTADALDEAVRRARHHRGIVMARLVLPELDARSRSRPESVLRWVLHEGGLPRPAVNQAVFSSLGEWLCEPDLSYDDVRVGVEYNGLHHAEVGRMRRDISRVLDVESRGGWRIVVVGPDQVFRRPDLAVNRVREVRREQSVLLGRRLAG